MNIKSCSALITCAASQEQRKSKENRKFTFFRLLISFNRRAHKAAIITVGGSHSQATQWDAERKFLRRFNLSKMLWDWEDPPKSKYGLLYEVCMMQNCVVTAAS